MFALDQWQEIFQSLQRHKLRTTLTAFGVFWGIFMFVLLLGVGTGLERGIVEIFKDDAVNSVWLEGGKTSVPYQGFTPGRQIKLTIDDVAALAQVLSDARNVSPRKTLPGAFPVTYGENASSFQILGVYPGYNVVEKTLLLSGRLLNPLDVSRRRKVALIGKRVVELLFGDAADPIGKRIIIKGVSFQVVGTFTDVGGEGELRRVYIPFTTLQECFDHSRTVDLITFTISPGSPAAP